MGGHSGGSTTQKVVSLGCAIKNCIVCCTRLKTTFSTDVLVRECGIHLHFNSTVHFKTNVEKRHLGCSYVHKSQQVSTAIQDISLV